MKKNRKTLKGSIACICILYVTLFCVQTIGCSEKPKEKDKAVAATETVQKPEKPKYDFPDEIYCDPNIWSEPRIQFVWAHPDDDYQRSIWSMKLDGTDVRRAVGPDLLAIDPGVKYAINVKPERSPDCRYIAVLVTDFSTYDVAHYTIIDLKNKTKKVFALDICPPSFNWTKDSRYLLFDARRPLIYDVTTQSLSDRPEILSRGFYLIDDDKQILALRAKKLEFYDREGNLLKTLAPSLKEKLNNKGNTISCDKSTVRLRGENGRYCAILRLNEPQQIIFESDNKEYNLSASVFLPGSEELIGDFYDRNGLSIYNIQNGSFKRLSKAELKTGFVYLSLINCPNE